MTVNLFFFYSKNASFKNFRQLVLTIMSIQIDKSSYMLEKKTSTLG